MSYVVTLVKLGGVSVDSVETFGPFDTSERAEAARRRIHFDNVRGDYGWRWARTFVSEIKPERAP